MTEDLGRAIQRAAAGVHAPADLRRRLDERPERRRARLVPRVALSGALAAVLAAVALLVSGGGPSIQDVAAVALHPAQRKAEPGLTVGGVTFGDYGEKWGWSPAGERTDEVSGRRAVTVIYRKGDLGVHYTVVPGRPIDFPDGGRTVRAQGRDYSVLRDGDTSLVAWHEDGVTCVLASKLVDTDTLLEFASWA